MEPVANATIVAQSCALDSEIDESDALIVEFLSSIRKMFEETESDYTEKEYKEILTAAALDWKLTSPDALYQVWLELDDDEYAVLAKYTGYEPFQVYKGPGYREALEAMAQDYFFQRSSKTMKPHPDTPHPPSPDLLAAQGAQPVDIPSLAVTPPARMERRSSSGCGSGVPAAR